MLVLNLLCQIDMMTKHRMLPSPEMLAGSSKGVRCQNDAQVGFYRGDVLLLLEDIEELQPTLFTSVPRLYNRIYDKVLNTMF
jgi:long-chain acyl-CoA synthetase